MDLLTLAVAAVMLALSAAAWSLVAGRLRAGESIIPLAPRRSVPWHFSDLLMIAAFYFLATLASYAIGEYIKSAVTGIDPRSLLQAPSSETTTATDLAVLTAASIATNLLTTAFALLWIYSHTNANSSDLGWRSDTAAGDVRLGLVTFAAIAAPIYGVQAFLSQFVEQQHPIIEVLSRERTPLVLLLSGISAIAVAPFAEELFFRVVLQGWLESVRTTTNPQDVAATEPVEQFPRRSAIVVTSLIFALLHLGHGADAVPLFFLALALGYLYQRTHRLLPSVTVHFCLNTCSFAMLCLSPPQ